MATLTTAYQNYIYNYLNRAVAPVTISNVYLRLFTGSPGVGASFAQEVVGGSYTGKLISNIMSTPQDGLGSLTTSVAYASMPACTVTHWAKCRNATGTAADEMIEQGPMAAPIVVSAGGTLTLAIGDLTSQAF